MADIRLHKIVNSLSKIQHKKYELYVLTGIIHGVNNPGIKYMFQQYVRRDEGNHALIDLYLPQFRIAIEVDEPQHYDKYPAIADKERLEDIAKRVDADMNIFALDARRDSSGAAVVSNGEKLCINCISEEFDFDNFAEQHLGDLCKGDNTKEYKMYVLRMICYNSDENDNIEYKSIEELNSGIACAVNIIKHALKRSSDAGIFKPLDHEEPVQHYRNQGYFSLDDDTELESVTDICRCFGVPCVQWGGREFADKYLIWWPKEGFEGNKWENELSEDGTILYEYPKTTAGESPESVNKKRKKHFEECKNAQTLRITFHRRLDAMKSKFYSFKGIYKLQDNCTEDYKCVWKRVSETCRLPKPYSYDELSEFVTMLENEYPQSRRKLRGIRARMEQIKTTPEEKHQLQLYHRWKEICRIDTENICKAAYTHELPMD